MKHSIRLISLFILSFLIMFIITDYKAESQLCEDFLILDGTEPLVNYGMDTTYNWWAVTEPYTGNFRLHTNRNTSEYYEYLTVPVYSISGDKYASFGKFAGSWYIITPEGRIKIDATEHGEILFSSANEEMVYSCFSAGTEYIYYGENKTTLTDRIGKLFTDFYGQNITYLSKRSNRAAIIINGTESTTYDEIIPGGYWNDGRFIYAARNGNSWAIYRNSEQISQNYAQISNLTINSLGTCFGALVQFQSGRMTGMAYSDEYYEPLLGKEYDKASDLVLHPYLPIVAYKARKLTSDFIIVNSAEYSGGPSTSTPSFSSDGEEFYYIGCDIDCFVGISGKQYNVSSLLSVDYKYAYAPGTKTFCYSTNASMIVRFLETQNMHAGMMTDQIISPRWNRFDGRYETLGSISNRLYLLTCRPNRQ